MKYRTAELDGELLDAAVIKAMPSNPDTLPFRPSTVWDDGGPIIEREGIGIEMDSLEPVWYADFAHAARADGVQRSFAKGPTPLVAAMRAYVASKLGEEVELP